MVLSKSQRGHRGREARVFSCSLVMLKPSPPPLRHLYYLRVQSAAQIAMGQRVEFPSNAHTCQGYFAGKGPGVVVIQEYWGLVPHIQDVVERFAAAGFAAIAPDLYHGKTAKSPDEAGRMLMELDADRAEREIAGAGEWLIKQPACTSKTYGVVGFCMGGALAQYTATKEKSVGAAVSFYGGFRKLTMEWKNLDAPILLI